MTLPSWPRPLLQPGGGDAHVFFKVHGDFSPRLQLRPEHRSAGLPNGVSLQLLRADAHPGIHALATDASWADALAVLSPEEQAAVRAAPACAVVRGVVSSPSTLDYLRDVIGLVQALLDAGGVAVCNLHQTRWWSAADWRAQISAPADPVPHRHVVIVHDEAPADRWYHTRGMRLFGRPDLSVRGVAPAQFSALPHLLDQLVRQQAEGKRLPDGLEVRLGGVASWRCETTGSLDDPQFHNTRVELTPLP